MKSTIALLALSLLSSPLSAADWPNWRGPNHNGSAEASNLPADFSKTQYVKWAVEMPGTSGATPIIVGDRVFVTSVDEKNQKLLAICIDRNSGSILWQDSAGSGYQANGDGNPTRLDSYSNYASPSPVSDGRRVVFFFGNGDLVAYDLDGKRLWARNIQRDFHDFTFQWTFGSSPTLYEGKLYMQVLQRDQKVHGRGVENAQSFLLAMDPATGKDIWKHIRKAPAQMESHESYGTPIPVEHKGRKELIIAGGDILTGHDPETGQEYWRWGTWNPDHREQWFRLVPSPAVGGGVVLGCGPKRTPVFAVKLGQNGDLSGRPALWASDPDKGVASDVPTPAYADGSFFILNDQKPVSLSRVEPLTGKVLWTTPMPGRYLYRGSPTVADGKVFTFNYRGDVTIVDAASGKIVNTIPMGEEDDAYTPSSIAVAHNQLFIRTAGKLYCVGK